MSKYNFTDLIKVCSDSRSPHWNHAWKDLIHRYNNYIYQNVSFACTKWKANRLKRQFSETINDIVSEVYITLLNSLSDFREVHNEKKFRLWLGIICSRSTSRYLKRLLIEKLVDENTEDFKRVIQNFEAGMDWELYESMLALLRSSAGDKKQYLERDINIFLMYIWSDLSPQIIKTNPCYQALGNRVIDNVIYRFRSLLRKKMNWVESFLL